MRSKWLIKSLLDPHTRTSTSFLLPLFFFFLSFIQDLSHQKPFCWDLLIARKKHWCQCVVLLYQTNGRMQRSCSETCEINFVSYLHPHSFLSVPQKWIQMTIKNGYKKQPCFFIPSRDRCHEITAQLTAPNDCHRKQITLKYRDKMSTTWGNTHKHTKRQECSLSGVIASHSGPINISVNTTFWSSVLESMKLAINPELALIHGSPPSQPRLCLFVGSYIHIGPFSSPSLMEENVIQVKRRAATAAGEQLSGL